MGLEPDLALDVIAKCVLGSLATAATASAVGGQGGEGQGGNGKRASVQALGDLRHMRMGKQTI